jgi:cobalt-precorrin 5A hydrolase/precorrin-3B C17-methyltransferase
MSAPEPVIVHLAATGAKTAARAAAALGCAVKALGPGATSELRSLFLAGRPIVAVMAAGVVIRALAPALADKRAEPPVVALADDASAAVPLLGGHRGANALARRLAEALGGVAAVTTAGDLRLGVALDEPPEGWRLETPADAKPAAAALLAGRPARLSGDADWLGPLTALPNISRSGAEGAVTLAVEGGPTLRWARRALALGVGCSRFCPPDELIALARETLAEAGRTPAEVGAVVSLDLKADETAVHALATEFDAPARFFDAATLEAETPRLANPSDTVFAEVGCHGVSEAAALAAAGPGGRLVAEKRKSANATCALALAPAPLGTVGRARGRLAVVGIGPGRADWRTPEADRLLAEADELVGYGLYLDLLGPQAATKAQRAFALGEETERCRYALERAGEGRSVALVCSGDGGIYAMGALVMELLDRPEAQGGVTAAARRVEVIHAPGISALQAASARTGALLGHDFCAISLSDLLTPRGDILARIRAAAEGDFVIAFYNPVSRRRRTLLAEARDILLAHRPAETLVLLARDLGRPDEACTVRTLGTLDVDEVDMLTTVLIGATRSRRFASGDRAAGAGGHWLYTPRGYARRIDAEDAP